MNSKLYKVLYVILVDNVSPPKEGEDELSKKMLGGFIICSFYFAIERFRAKEQSKNLSHFMIY